MKAAPLACALLLISPAQLWLPDVVATPKSEVRITFSPDGKRMLWGAIGWNAGGWDIYESERSATGWSTPRAVSFNSTANDFDPSFAPDGTGVYFFSNRDGGFGKDDLYFAPLEARTGRYGAGKNLGATLNSAGDNGHRSCRPTASDSCSRATGMAVAASTICSSRTGAAIAGVRSRTSQR